MVVALVVVLVVLVCVAVIALPVYMVVLRLRVARGGITLARCARRDPEGSA